MLAEIAVFRASHGVDPADTRIMGPEQYRRRSSMAQNGLRRISNEILPEKDSAMRRWQRIVEAVDPRLTADWFWPQLAAHLDDVAHVSADVGATLRRAMESGGPLPDELPAAALWWRLAGGLSVTKAEATTDVGVEHPNESRQTGETWTLDLIFDREEPLEDSTDHSELLFKPERYTIESDVDQLQAEVAVIGAAGSRSPATCYNPALVGEADPSIKTIAVAIADSDMAVQLLRCATAGDTHAALRSLAVAAYKSGQRVLALPATAAAADRALHYRYSHASLAAAEGIPKLQSGQSKLPVGALIIVDDADYLTDEQITWLMTHAGATNTKVVLAASRETAPGPSRYLTDVLTEKLPWSVDRDRLLGSRSTAISRISNYLNTIECAETASEKCAAELLAQCDACVNRYRQIAAPLHARSGAVAERARDAGLSL